MKLRPFATSLATAAALTLAAPAWADYVFSVSALPNPVVVGEIVKVDVSVTQDDDYGFNLLSFDLTFDPNLLAFIDADPLSLDLFILSQSTLGSSSTLSTELASSSLFDFTDTGPIATFSFKALREGISALDLQIGLLTSDKAYLEDFASFDPLTDDLDDVGVRTNFATVPAGSSVEVLPQVTNGVPIPGTLLLASLGLALLGWTRRPHTASPAA